MIKAYYKRLTSNDEKIRLKAAKLWTTWEMATSKLIPDNNLIDAADDDLFALAFARIECHYFINNALLEDKQILRDAHKIAHIPCTIIQGRYDVVCPATSAWELHQVLPKSKLYIIPDAGHSRLETGIANKLLEATDLYCS